MQPKLDYGLRCASCLLWKSVSAFQRGDHICVDCRDSVRRVHGGGKEKTEGVFENRRRLGHDRAERNYNEVAWRMFDESNGAIGWPQTQWVRIPRSKDESLDEVNGTSLSAEGGASENWPERKVRALREMWGVFGANQIAQSIGKTRIAVCRKAARMGLVVSSRERRVGKLPNARW